MSRADMELILQDKRLSLRRPDATYQGTLCDWLESQGYPLNTRCGNRGLCRGCEVLLPGGKTIKSCQVQAAELTDCSQLVLPERSLKDASLQGVSAFELLPAVVHEPRDGIGLAIDVGTTTLAAALWDLSSGQCIASGSRANAQSRYGDNVLTRIEKGTTTEGLCHLHQALVQDSLKPLMDTLCNAAGVESMAITEAVAAGNPAMLHTLAQADMTGLSRYPFAPAFIDGMSIDPCQHRLDLPCAIELLPGVGPFVGADITAGTLATDFFSEQSSALLVDFGTNGEILLNVAGKCYATATAMGPAFEGGRLACGAFAAPGVIASVAWHHNAWQFDCIGDTDTAKGISGAAYIDFMALGRKAGWLTSSGRFAEDAPELQAVEDEDGAHERRVYLTRDIYVSEADIAELLQAKAAIAAGIESLCEVAGISLGAIEVGYVAGGFGYHLNLAHACAVGLLPSIDADRLKTVGNSSLGGASLWLQCPSKRLVDADWRTSIQYLELNQQPSFEDYYLDHLMLP